MRQLHALAGALLVLALVSAARLRGQEAVQEATPLAFAHVSVVDVESGRVLPDRTVVIAGNRIRAVGPSASVRVPTGTHVVEAAGKYLIPGLWDMHTHAVWPGAADYFIPLYVANGITGIRDMHGDRAFGERLRSEAANGTRLVPRLVVAGNLIDGPHPVDPQAIIAATPERGRAIVDSLSSVGVPFVKISSSLAPNVFRAIAQGARERGLPFLGHVPLGVSAREASDLGQRSIEHPWGVEDACSQRGDSIVVDFAAALNAETSSPPRGGNGLDFESLFRARDRRILEGFDTAHCDAFLRHLAAKGTWWTPTLVAFRGIRYPVDSVRLRDPRMRYLPEATRRFWQAPFPMPPRRVTAADWEAQRRIFQLELAITGRAAHAGVPLLAGTDVPLPFAFPGFGLHDELGLFVSAGLTPLDALRTATVNPARFLGATDSLGTVVAGKVADLVLLDGNPLEDIANTGKIQAVVLNGRYLDRPALDRVLAEEAKLAASATGRDTTSP